MGDKINKQRAEIKAIKERKRREKAEREMLEQEAQSPRGRALSASKSKSKLSLETKKKKKKKKKTRLDSDSDDNYDASPSPRAEHPHERHSKVIKADSGKWDNDWDKINKQRAEIKAIKEKKRISKLQNENDLKERNKKKKDGEEIQKCA